MEPIARCIIVNDIPTVGLYQQRARIAFEHLTDRSLLPQSWIITTCGQWCLNAQHMVVKTPIKIAYPPGVCVYCGFPAGTRDHLVPRPESGEARRAFVAVVPACAECNSRIGVRGGPNINDRRRIAHAGIRRKNNSILRAPDRTEEEIQAEFEGRLRKYISSRQIDKAVILTRLAWPEDPFYDVAAFQRSGIEDPIALGLCDSPILGRMEGAA